MIKYLYGKLCANQWLDNSDPDRPVGALLRRTRGSYVTEPTCIPPDLLEAVARINVEVAFTISTGTTQLLFSILKPKETSIMLPDGSQIQIIDSLSAIIRSGSSLVKKFQYGALIREEQILLVWHDELGEILAQAASIEEKLLCMV
jgi:hypothetical protein